MAEPTSETPLPHESFKWHIPEEDLLAMTDEQRTVYLNQKADRLYDALSAWAAGEGLVSPLEIDMILNPEQYPDPEA